MVLVNKYSIQEARERFPLISLPVSYDIAYFWAWSSGGSESGSNFIVSI